ncbi:hypothetical protein CEXT_35191 [Caerostris extrusa]|uniref:CCHC-type domain-containing protein n=1 Tax=Caerostris extrusa TaxID=172846 RepID=A0AAV4Y5R3_CAEEX|nr:hypothetical protein CEXT_35191 [Caerostris extrusa]
MILWKLYKSSSVNCKPFFCGSGGFALRVERSFEVASKNANVILQADLNAVEGIKDDFTKSLDLVLKQLEHVNTRIDALDKQKDISENSYKNQPPSQRRDRKPLKCFYCGRLGHIASECERKSSSVVCKIVDVNPPIKGLLIGKSKKKLASWGIYSGSLNSRKIHIDLKMRSPNYRHVQCLSLRLK